MSATRGPVHDWYLTGHHPLVDEDHADVHGTPFRVVGMVRHPTIHQDAEDYAARPDDAARGLGLRFIPDLKLAGRVLARLFPWHDPGSDAWQTLLWANRSVVTGSGYAGVLAWDQMLAAQGAERQLDQAGAVLAESAEVAAAAGLPRQLYWRSCGHICLQGRRGPAHR